MTTHVMLVHGLGGSPERTWGKFPELLSDDPDLNVRVLEYKYSSPQWYKIWASGPSIVNIANGLLSDIRNRDDINIDDDEFILVGHSLGGLIIKKFLLRLQTQHIKLNIRKVCFFDVPHNGSGYAALGILLGIRNRHLRSLVRGGSELDDLNDQWLEGGLDSKYEVLSIIAADDDIVSSSSAKSIFRQQEIETVNNVNHRSIVKPDSRGASSYIFLKNFILRESTIARFRNRASRNLNEWKRIERNHSYEYVSDEKRNSSLESLLSALEVDNSIVRVTGSSGLGKSRLLLEAITRLPNCTDETILVFDAPGYEREVKESVRQAVVGQARGLMIIENCGVGLHNTLVREAGREPCHLRVVTIGYDHESVDNSIHIQLAPLSKEAIKELLTPILAGMESSDIERVAMFAEGYPLLATLIAEGYQKNGELLSSIEKASVVKKLIEGDSGVNDAEMSILTACSLFDVFGTEQHDAALEAKFIAEEVAGSTLSIFDKVIHRFSKRQILRRAGRYARVIPKPLALTLAREWWNEASYERQKHLIDNLPESLLQSFCVQSSYLDSHPNVQRFSEKLFGAQGPLMRAEKLITEKGSKLFRAFVEVNPQVTSAALYACLQALSHDELLRIQGDTRRNLVWALEKLCFHADFFEDAAWCMLLLASAENETWSNNATGMFAQLFRVHLSGTGASPRQRFDVLRRAMSLKSASVDAVVEKALQQAISTYGGSRTIGAEYQGTKAALEEWQPKIYKDIYEYWQEAFDLMLSLFDRGEVLRGFILTNIGHSIRGFVARNRIDMLDSSIRKIIEINGRYWPAALESINNTFEHDAKSLDDEAVNALNSWLELLKPDDSNLPEKLRIVVINPPWSHHKGDDGKYVNIAADNAKALASEFSQDLGSLLPNIDLLVQGDQKQTYSFGKQLALELTSVDQLLEKSFQAFIAAESSNLNLLLGIFDGVHSKSPDEWQSLIDRVAIDEVLMPYYPEFIRTGNIKRSHLDVLLGLVERGVIPEDGAETLSYGSVTENLGADDIGNFCLSLSAVGEKASWTALHIIFMYCFGKDGSMEVLRDTLKQLVVRVSLKESGKNSNMDVHHWHEISKNLLKIRDEGLATDLVGQLISDCKFGFNHSDIWNNIKPLLIDLMSEYHSTIWPVFGNAIIAAKGAELSWLQQLLDREDSFSNQHPSVLSILPSDDVIAWCKKTPELGPQFVAASVNIFEGEQGAQTPSQLFVALLQNFGDDDDVASSLTSNTGTRSWSGSLVPYLESERNALTPLLECDSQNVRLWVRRHLAYIERQLSFEADRDEERGLGIY